MHASRKIKKGNVDDFIFADEEDEGILSNEDEYQQISTKYGGPHYSTISALDYEKAIIVEAKLEIDMEENSYYAGISKGNI
jgi:hypothetical protein